MDTKKQPNVYPKMKLELYRGRKLMPKQIKEIKKKYKKGDISLSQLGRDYGVSYHTIKFHVSDKEKARVAVLRERYHERGRTDPEAHRRVLQLRKEHQEYKLTIQYDELREYYNKKAVEFNKRHKKIV